MRLCSYTVAVDRGLAPNPFWGYCTLAVCTPNHMGIRLQSGDWIMGTASVSRGSKLVYAMEISEVLCFEHYYRDPRFEKKKPNVKGTWRERCGDNMYFKNSEGVWEQHSTLLHTDQETITKDQKHPYVFIAEHFYYFGNKAATIPSEYQNLIWKRRGCKCEHPRNSVAGFLNWLQTNFKPGICDRPYDNDEALCTDC